MAVKSVSVVPDSLETHTADVMNHHDRFANQIHALQMVSVSFKRTVNQFAIAHLVWEVRIYKKLLRLK